MRGAGGAHRKLLGALLSAQPVLVCVTAVQTPNSHAALSQSQGCQERWDTGTASPCSLDLEMSPADSSGQQTVGRVAFAASQPRSESLPGCRPSPPPAAGRPGAESPGVGQGVKMVKTEGHRLPPP